MLKVTDIAEDEILFFDLETDSQFGPYCNLKMIGAQEGLKGKPFLVETWGQKKRFREMLADPDIIKVAFNNYNFDNLVLWRYGFPVNPSNCHDIFLMAKTVAPRLPAYSLKFINWYYFGDFHPPEMEMNDWMQQNGVANMWQAPKNLLSRYCLYDVHPQTTRLFRMFWEVVQRPEHWTAYTEVELPAGIVMEEIMLRGGEYLNEERIDARIKELRNDKLGWEHEAWVITDGKVTNPNSVAQVGQYLQDEEQVELELTDKGNFQLKQGDLLEFLNLDDPSQDRQRIMRCLYEVRKINNALSYYNNYKAALEHCIEHQRMGWIPKQYSLSAARTRRILSNSYYKLNFQNPNKAAKEVQVVPPDWLGVWFDATQIENVVHIYESNDHERRRAYEADENWNEYVWLCCKALGVNLTKEELDDLNKYPFQGNPSWTVYKGYKTVKLAINFGMGEVKYAKQTRLPQGVAKRSFADVVRACPAIRQLQQRIAADLNRYGYVTDVFGHRYSAKEAYKLVAYLIQGTGTGSLPKVQMAANYDTIHQWDRPLLKGEEAGFVGKPVVIDKPRGIVSYGVMTGTTHDENSCRLSLMLSEEQIIATLQQMHWNMTKMLESKFDGIPLRAKMYLSRTTTAEREEVNINDLDKIRSFIWKNRRKPKALKESRKISISTAKSSPKSSSSKPTPKPKRRE